MFLRSFGIVLLPYLLVALLHADEPRPGPGDWPLDLVRLKNGTIFRGVILEENPLQVHFQCVRRHPGRPTITLTCIWSRNEIDSLEKITAAQREQIRARLAELDPTGEGEQRRMEMLELQRIDWNGKKKAAWRYESDYFALLSTAPEDTVRRVGVRLEQIYTAYTRFLPPTNKGGKPVTVVLLPRMNEYRELLLREKRTFSNPAFYDPALHRIICGNDLQRLGEDLESNRKQHREALDELARQETQIRKLFANKKVELERYLQGIQSDRKRIQQTNRHNDTVFDKANQQMYGILYHEAFHAYVTQFVYPPCPQALVKKNGPTGELPRWLNEGLAQIFETAFVEAGELRLGHADRERLQRTRDSLLKKELLSVAELLKTGPKEFIVLHGEDKIGSDRAYLTSWAVAHYLLFQRKMIGHSAFAEFLCATNSGGVPVEAFARLVNQPLDAFEKDFQSYMLRLTPAGTLAPEPPKK